MDQQLLKRALANGCSRRLAEMLACRKPPGQISDAIPGLACANPLPGVPDDLRPVYEARAKQAGVNVKGKRYVATLARYPGDPMAYVESKSEVRTKSDRMRVDDTPVDPSPPLAEDIVERHAVARLAEDGCDGTCTVREWEDTKDKVRSEMG